MTDFMVGFGSPSPIGFGFGAVAVLLIVAGWVIVAGSRFVQGGVVENPQRVPQLYGYSACLIALIVGLVSVKSIVESSLTISDPLYYNDTPGWGGWGDPSVTSFEAFRATYDRAREMRANPNQPPPAPLADSELQRRYEAMRADRLTRNRVAAKRSLVINSFSLALAIGVFFFHWRWLRDRVRTALPA